MERLLRLTQRLSTTTTGTEKRVEHIHKALSDDTAASNKQVSPFLRLPTSVRKRIYGYVLGGLQIRVCDTKSCKRSHRCRSRNRKLSCPAYFHLPRRRLTLLATCRQIRLEAMLLPFSLNEFDGEHWDIHLAVYYRLTDAQVSAITNIRIYFGKLDVHYEHSLKTTCPVVKLGSHLISTLQTLGRLRGLRQITIEWASWHSGVQDWPTTKRQISEMAKKELERVRRISDIEVVIVGCKCINES